MDGIELRTATPADAEVVAAYHERCFRTTYAALLLAGVLEVPDLVGTTEQLRGWFQAGSGFDTQLAVVEGVPVGHVTVQGHQLCHLFVEPERQGTGLGRYLLELGEATIAADGHLEFELHARIENTAAIAFYEHAGWTSTDRLVHTAEHGIRYDERVLVKRLEPVR
ncbi:hypothetical protein BH10ACT1_BH10ACT1_16740 [soil metagenome]